MTTNTESRDELATMAVAKVTQYQTLESDDPSVERLEMVECTEATDDIVELAFNLRPGRQRTYLRMNRADLLRMIGETR